jgi:hypothetical protein
MPFLARPEIPYDFLMAEVGLTLSVLHPLKRGSRENGRITTVNHSDRGLVAETAL